MIAVGPVNAPVTPDMRATRVICVRMTISTRARNVREKRKVSSFECSHSASRFHEQNSNYYSILLCRSFTENSSLICEKCHEACKDSCSGSGPEHCTSGCNSGWEYKEDSGCLDLNECSNATACPESEFCVNEPGSFRCEGCDASCASCSGPGVGNCTACAPGYRHGTPRE